MANWFTRIVDRVTPWDRGGEVQRRQEKKKRDEEQRMATPTVKAPQPKPSAAPTVKSPTNLFDDLNKNLTSNTKINAVPVVKNYDSVMPSIPKPGTVVHPDSKPFDMGAPIRATLGVPAGAALGVLRAGTGLVEGAAELPTLAGKASDWIANKVSGNKGEYYRSPVTKAIEKVTNVVTKPLKWVGKKTDEAAIGFGTGSRAVYKPAQIATNIATIVPGVVEGSAAVAGKLSQAGKIAEESKVLGSLNKARNLAESQRVSPILKAIDDATGGNLSKSKWLSKFMPKSETPNVVKVPVKKDIPVDEVIGSAEDIPVKVTPKPEAPKGPLIREIGGDAPKATAMPTPEEVAAQRAVSKFADQPKVRPDMNIEGVTPTPRFNTPLGEAKGVTKIELDTERAMLDDALANKEMTKTQHKAANKALDDVVPTDAVPSQGRKIEVKQITPIDVTDNTIMPQNLPETPGQVRITTATAPNNAKSAAVAAQTPPVAPVAAKTSAADVINDVPTTPKQADGASELENLVKNLRENQKAYKGEKKLRKAEFGRRQAEKQRLYEQYRAEGMSGQEAKRAADKALGGKYTKSFASNPEVSEKTVNKILDKTRGDQNTQNAFARWFDPNRPEALRDWERTRIRAYFQKELGEEAAQSVDEAIVMAEQAGDRSVGGRIADFVTSSIAAGDISGVGRQGLSGWINHPGMSKGAWDDALKALMSADGEKKFAAQLVNNPNVAFIQENMGGKFQTLSDIADEARGSMTSNKLTSWYVNPSNRHYNTYLDSLRLRQKEAIISRYGGQEGFMKAAQAANPEDPKKWMKAWNDVIDRQSGRGSFGKAGSPNVGDMQVLFSARNLASKFQRLTAPFQVGLLKTNPAAYLYQLKETATQAAVLGATLTALSKSGIVEIENGKLKIGNTRVDITGGFATIFKAGNDLRKAMGIMQDTSKDSGYDRSGWTVATDFIKNQLAPTIGSLARLADVNWGKGEDKYGNEIDAKWWLNTAPLPAIANTAINSVSEGQNLLETARNVGLDAIGLGTNTYQSADDKKAAAMGKDVYKNLKDTAKQLEKDGISTESGDVSNYVADGEYDKAERAIKYKLMEAQAGPDASPSKIKKIENTLQEVQLRRDGVPIDDDEIQSTIEQGDYDSALQGLSHKLSGLEGSSDAKRKPVETDIKRLEVTRDGDYDPSIIKLYQNMSNAEWRKMGDPEDEDYNPDVYQALWAYDDAMAAAGVSRSDFTPDKQKYSAKKTGSGSGSKKFSTDFGTLKAGSFTPKVQQYDTIDAKSGAIPIIRTVRPNIVHEVRGGR